MPRWTPSPTQDFNGRPPGLILSIFSTLSSAGYICIPILFLSYPRRMSSTGTLRSGRSAGIRTRTPGRRPTFSPALIIGATAQVVAGINNDTLARYCLVAVLDLFVTCPRGIPRTHPYPYPRLRPYLRPYFRPLSLSQSLAHHCPCSCLVKIGST